MAAPGKAINGGRCHREKQFPHRVSSTNLLVTSIT